MVEGLDFNYIVNDKDEEYIHIQLLTGPYAGVIYRYGKVGFEEKNGQLHLQFDFNVIQSPNVKASKLEKDSTFKQHIGDYLISVIEGNLEQEFIDETGTDDLKESDLQ